jgi:subtilisin family serine protease
MRSRLLSTAAAVSLAAAGLLAIEPTAHAAPPPAPGAPAPVSHTVTLVTGDVVTLTTLGDGQQVAEVDRPDDATGGVVMREIGDDLYVLPDEALPLITAQRLDRRLFNVTDLIEMGYDDAHTASVPLIAAYSPALARAANPPAPRGSKTERTLASIGGAALTADKKQARTFWTTVAPAGASAFGAGVAKLWLDGKVQVTLAESVPMVGAPQAWSAGYDGTGVTVAVLDTGVDAAHPDLADQIVDKVSFVPGLDTSDVNGHGTHVASTVAGTGAASGGTHKGVAPGADLLIGKVLDNDGFGQDSWVVAGMEWAAQSADIVSMSLGDTIPTDGTDPMSVAVDTLTAQHGALFVIAAGNSGPGSTISWPAAAASALTVGAVDKQDNLAWFSSTGPLVNSGAIKPDIAAPGVAINAARSQQMPGGDGMYWSIDGTSMATPHVSGAAAIMAQRHPDWSWQRLKDALMSSAMAVDYTPYEVGAGRLDVAAAVRNTVQATGSAFFGNYLWPHEPTDVATKTVTFTNSGDSAVTVDLEITGDSAYSLGSPTVTVPAAGSADVTVTGDATKADAGPATGYLIGTDAATGTAVTHTALGLVKEPERYDLTVKLIGRDGAPASGNVLIDPMTGDWPYFAAIDGEATLRLPPGSYVVDTALEVPGEGSDRLGFAVLVDPETVLTDGPEEVVLDARNLRLADAEAPKPTEDRQRRLDFSRALSTGYQYRAAYGIPVRYDDTYVLPTEPVREGWFAAVTRWRKGEPTMSVTDAGGTAYRVTAQPGTPVVDGKASLRAVYAGTGAPEAYEGIDATGKAVVVTRSDEVSAPDRAAAAAAAGAKLLIVVNDGPGVLNEWVGPSAIPVGTVHRDAGARLVEQAKADSLRLAVRHVAYASYVYDLTRNYADQIPDRDLAYRPTEAELARVDARYFGNHSVEGGGYRYDITEGFVPAFGFPERERFPGTRTEWVTPGQVWHETHTQDDWEERGYRDVYRIGPPTTVDWFAPVVRPASGRGYFGPQRWRDYLTINLQAFTGAGTVDHGGAHGWGSMPMSMSLYQGDRLVEQNDFYSDMQYVEVPSETLPYRLVLDASRPAEQWRLSTRQHTEWEFVSGTVDSDDFVTFPLLQLNYEIETDLRGNAKAGVNQQIRVHAGPQPGATLADPVKSMTLELSYDDGATWQPVTLHGDGGGWWSASVKLPKTAGGHVSVRGTASTGTGWGIEQEIIRAFGLG